MSRRRVALSVFAMLACAGIALVTVTDPYAGATANPYYQSAPRVVSEKPQKWKIDGGYVLVDIKRDKYTVVQPAAPKVSSPSSSTAGIASYTTPSGVAQAYAAEQVAAKGWDGSQFTCLVDLWNRESGWNTHAENPSGAYGIPQSLPGSKMAAFGSDWQNDYKVQINWGLAYISGSYGSPCGAWASSQSRGWY